MKITSDLTKYQATSIDTWQFDMAEMRQIEGKDEIAKAALNKFINRNGSPIDVHRTNGRRVFNPFTAMKRTHRKFVSFQGSPLIEIDAANSHPLIMVYKMISEGFEVETDLKIAVESGTFYDYLIENGKTRSETKELWFSFCYAKELKTDHPVYIKLLGLFPKFIESFTNYAADKNLSEYLQELESRIWIDKISMSLMRADIKHITIHDSVVFAGVQHVNKVLDIIYAAFGSIRPPLHVEYLNGEKLQFVRVENPDNSKYLSPDYMLLDELHQCKADPFKTVDRPDTAVYMLDNGKEIPMFTLGNFSAISGKSKSGKTLLISAIVASALNSDVVIGKFMGALPDDKSNIVYIDTEMADYDFQWVMKRVVTMSNMKRSDVEAKISFYRLREKDTAKRIELIDAAIRTTKNVGMVIIDGIRDIVKDINNPEESTNAMDYLMKWTDMYKIHLLTVLHQNPGKEAGNKLRGHIGTEAMNKAESVISIIKQEGNDLSIVNGDFMRRESFKSFGIQYDPDTNLPIVVEHDESVKVKYDTIDDVDIDNHKYIIDTLFEEVESYKKTDFLKIAKQLMSDVNINVTVRAMNQFYDFWIDSKLIVLKQEKQTKYVFKQ